MAAPDNYRRRSDLSDEKRRLLEQRLRNLKRPEASLIPRRAPGETAFASYAQQRLWFLDQLFPGNSFYNIPAVLPISTALDPPLLERCLNQIIERHEILRTSFSAVDGQPVQIVAPHLELPLEINDLTRLDPSERQAEAERLAAAVAARPFDLARAPLLRATLLRLAPYDHVLLLTMHHIISDGWSLGVLWRELGEFYSASLNGHSPALPPLPVQYADYAVWQREYLSGDVLERQLQYWEQQLRDAQPLELPTDKPRPPVPSFRGDSFRFILAADVTARLRQLSQQQGATLFMTLLAGFAALLWRYTGQSQIVVGAPVSGRTRAELESLIGVFINTLVLPIEVGGNPSFTVLLERVRELTLAAYEYQDVPFEMLVERLQPERDLSRNPLFQLVFQLLNLPGSNNLTPAPKLEVRRGTTMFDLSVSLWEVGDVIHTAIEYNDDLYEEPAIKRMAGHYQRLLEQVAKEPRRRLSELELLSGSERRQLLHTFNQTVTSLPQHASLPALFDAQVERTPAATALICDEQEITYSELQRRANRLAQHLRRTGVGPETRVGICLPRSIEMVVAFLAVLKTGGVYVPLDPSYPVNRLKLILEEADLAVLITKQHLTSSLDTATAPPFFYLDDEHEQLIDCSEENPPRNSLPQQLAYIIYTSGSTGKPKGVAVEQLQILNRLEWMWREYPFTRDEVCCQKTALNFVDSLWELLGPLLQGVPTVIVPDENVKDLNALVQSLSDFGVSRLWLVPSLLSAMLDGFSDLSERLPKLKFWVSSGEILTRELAEKFEKTMAGATLYNLYGTSEVWDVTWYDAEQSRKRKAGAAQNQTQQRVSIGWPIDNMEAYVLDAHLQPVPPGIAGELYVGGIGLARGYLNHPELTADRFIPHPFSNSPGRRLYRTGDLARHLDDGIDLIGRADQQLKIRGYRVEPAEVETALARHSAVKKVVVLAHENGDGPRLIAYVVTHDQNTVSVTELQDEMAAWVPDYMIPAGFVFLDHLPLTPSGKIDRTKLQTMATESTSSEEYVEPRNELEKRLVEMMIVLLGAKRIGINDHFFRNLGGHSLSATRLIARVREAFNVDLALRDFFESPSVAGLAVKIERQRQQAAPQGPALVRLSRDNYVLKRE